MSLAVAKFTPMELPSRLRALTSLAADSTSRTSLSPPSLVFMAENASSRLWMLGAIWLTWARTVPRLSANVLAPAASRRRSPPRWPISAEPVANRSPTIPA